MATPFTPIAGSASIGATEFSLPNGSTTLTPQTAAIKLVVHIDATAMVAGDQYRVQVIDKINGGSQLVIWEGFITGSTPQAVRVPMREVNEGWDVRVKLMLGSAKTLGWSLKEDVGDRQALTLGTNAINAAAIATDADAQIAGAVWDELITGATHNINNSAGKRMRQIGATAIRSDIAQGGGNGINQIQLDAAASSVDGIYDKNMIVITAGPGIGQSRAILRYDGATRMCTVERDWRTGQSPTSASEFQIFGAAYLDSVTEGLAAAGTSTTITLDSGAPSIDDSLTDNLITIYSGVGEGQTRRIIGYVGATHVATIEHAWVVTPDATSGYIVTVDAPINPTALATVLNSLASILSRLPAALDGAGNIKAGVQSLVSGATAAISDAVWSAISEGTETMVETIRLIASRLFGGGTVRDGDGHYTFESRDGSKTRLDLQRAGNTITVVTRDGT
jgi:hypothetical protein